MKAPVNRLEKRLHRHLEVEQIFHKLELRAFTAPLDTRTLLLGSSTGHTGNFTGTPDTAVVRFKNRDYPMPMLMMLSALPPTAA